LSTSPHISVVDDDISVRESLAGLFKAMGFAVEMFASAEEFLSSKANLASDCLILDIGMPGMSGLDLYLFLTKTNVKIPVVFITASDDSQVRAKALEAGAVAFLIKPFNEHALLNAVQTALGAT
jgi:FixJ family two-component response regulator